MSQEKEYAYAEIQKHTSKDDIWFVIHGKVYDATKFMDEHPGGDEVLLGEAGKDATEAFEDVGHSDEARDILKEYLVGICSDVAPPGTTAAEASRGKNQTLQDQTGAKSFGYLLPLALLVAYFSWKFLQ